MRQDVTVDPVSDDSNSLPQGAAFEMDISRSLFAFGGRYDYTCLYLIYGAERVAAVSLVHIPFDVSL